MVVVLQNQNWRTIVVEILTILLQAIVYLHSALLLLEVLISGSGGNFDNLVDRQFICGFLCCTILTIHMLFNIIIKLPTIKRNQTYCACFVN